MGTRSVLRFCKPFLLKYLRFGGGEALKKRYWSEARAGLDSVSCWQRLNKNNHWERVAPRNRFLSRRKAYKGALGSALNFWMGQATPVTKGEVREGKTRPRGFCGSRAYAQKGSRGVQIKKECKGVRGGRDKPNIKHNIGNVSELPT